MAGTIIMILNVDPAAIMTYIIMIILGHLNSIRVSIQLIMEQEEGSW